MARYGKTTKLDSVAVLEQAVQYFGPGGLGLNLREKDHCHVILEGAGGFVQVTTCGEDKATNVDLTTREWDIQAKTFLGKI